MPAIDEATISTAELCRRAGCTYRQADLWDRAGLVPATVPAAGSGSRRRYTADDVVVARAISALMTLGATGEVVRRAAMSIRAGVAAGFGGERLFIDLEGRVTLTVPAAGHGWIVDLAA